MPVQHVFLERVVRREVEAAAFPPLTGAWRACTLAPTCALGQAADDPPPAVEERTVPNAPAEMIEAASCQRWQDRRSRADL
jgi:hypothetical protein